MYVCGVSALLVVVRHIAILMEYVTIGPMPLPLRGSAQGTAVYFLFEDLGLSAFLTGDAALLAGLVLSCSGAVLAGRLRHSQGTRVATILVQMVVALSVLACSYRFVGLIAVLCVVGWEWIRRPVGWIRWVVWAAAVAVCFVPYDVTCRNLEGPARLETSIHCGTATASAEYAANRRVCVGSDAPIYNEPTGVWVW